MGGLSKLDEFLLNSKVRTCSLAVPGTTRNSDSGNREFNRDRSPNDPCPEAEISSHHSGDLSSSEVEEYPHMGTGVPEEIRKRPHTVTRIQEVIPYCSPGISSRKQKKPRTTRQPQFRSANNPATIVTDSISLALQQMATNSNSATFNNNINRISKFRGTLATTMPTIDGKS